MNKIGTIAGIVVGVAFLLFVVSRGVQMENKVKAERMLWQLHTNQSLDEDDIKALMFADKWEEYKRVWSEKNDRPTP